MLTLANIETQLKPKLFKKDLLRHRISRRDESSLYMIFFISNSMFQLSLSVT